MMLLKNISGKTLLTVFVFLSLSIISCKKSNQKNDNQGQKDCEKIVTFSEQEMKKINPKEGLAESIKKEMLRGCLKGYKENPAFARCVSDAKTMKDFTGCH